MLGTHCYVSDASAGFCDPLLPHLLQIAWVPFLQPSLSPISAWPTPEPPCWGPPPQPLALKPSHPLGLRLFISEWLIESIEPPWFTSSFSDHCHLSPSQLHLQGERPQMSSADLQTQAMIQETKALLYSSGSQTTPLTHPSVPHPQPSPISTLAFPISQTSSKETIHYPLRYLLYPLSKTLLIFSQTYWSLQNFF